MSEDDRLGAQARGLTQWFTRSPAEIEQERQAALAAGRQAYADAIRTGHNVLARTENEIVALGRSRLAQQAAQAARNTADAVRDPDAWREAGLQADTAVRTAANTLTFGAANPISAGMNTLLGEGGSGSLAQRFQRNLDQENARDAYDAVHRPTARAIGEAAGIGLSVLDGAAAGRALANGMSRSLKGTVGEVLSLGKSFVSGDVPKFKPGSLRLDRKPIELSNGLKTIPDHVQKSGRVVEAKFGFSAGLSRNQRQAQRELGAGYRVDRWTPDHIGYATGALQGGAAGAYAGADEDQ